MSELPSRWVEATLGGIAQFVMGQAPPGSASNFEGVGSPFVKAGEFGELRPIIREWTTQPLKFASREDILICVVGATAGKINLGEDCAIGRSVAAIRPVESVSQYFLYNFLKTTILKLREGSVGSAQGVISKDDLSDLALPLPPLAEQKRIVAKLDALNAKSARARTELSRIETLVSRYKQAVLSKAFSGELTREWREFRGVTLSASEKFAIGEALQRALSSRRGARTNTHQVNFNAIAAIPSSWAHAVVGVGADMTVGFGFKSEWFRADGVKLLRGANIAPRAIDWSELKCLDPSRAKEFARYLVEENDIVLAMDRPVISTGLKVARVARDDAGCLLVQRVTRFRASEFVTQDFFWWFLNSQMFLAHSLHRATGSDLPHISGDDIATCPFPLPPLKEQHEIVRRIESAFAKIDRLAKEAKRALELLGRLDEAILGKAFRGELVPQDENDEPAEKLLERIRAEREAAPKVKRGRGKAA